MAMLLPVLWDVLEEHFEEAAFLWRRWEKALDSPVVTRSDITGSQEELLRAHLDALRLGGPDVAERLLVPALEASDAEKAFVAAFTLIAGDRVGEVVGALRANGAVRSAVRRAFELSGSEAVRRHLHDLAIAPNPAQAEALQAHAFHAIDVGAHLDAAAESEDEAVVCAALRAARASPATRAVPIIVRALYSGNAAVRDEAIEAGLVFSMREAWQACLRAAGSSSVTPRIWLLVALGADGAEIVPLLRAAREKIPDEAVVWALGSAGRVSAADTAVAAMASEDERLSRLAGEAFSAITGLRIEGEYEAGEEAEDEGPVQLEEDDPDEELISAPEDVLPLPDADAIAVWWSRERARFDPSVRYVRGRPLTPEAIQSVFADGSMRRSHSLALELEIRSRGKVRPRTRFWACEQHLPPSTIAGDLLARPFSRLLRGS